MLQFTPTGNNLYNIESDVDLGQILLKSDELMDVGRVEEACQIRYDVTVEALEQLDKFDDAIELNMQNAENQDFVDLIVKCGIDHYFISDFEIAAAIFETALDLDPEDHYGATANAGFCYAGLQEWDSLDAIIESGVLQKEEAEFLEVFQQATINKKTKTPQELKNIITDPNSQLCNFVTPLKNALPETFNTILL